jgi:hypothetical protein
MTAWLFCMLLVISKYFSVLVYCFNSIKYIYEATDEIDRLENAVFWFLGPLVTRKLALVVFFEFLVID